MDGCFEPGLIGCLVRLVAEEGEYRGTVHAVNPRDASVRLVGVTFQCGGREEPLRGVQKFVHGDVRSISVLECGPDDSAAAPTARSAGAPQKGPPPPAGRDNQVLDRGSRGKPMFSQKLVDDSLLLSHVAIDDSDDSSSAETGPGEQQARRPRAASPPPLLPRPEGYALVETAEELEDAVSFLNGQTNIGLAAEGVLLGRAGQLSLVSLACEEFVFIVDVPTCGGAAALRLLQPLLENRRVGKVVHDSRGLSDLLWHQAQTRLVNVFDTQAAEVYLYHRHFGAMPQYVSNVAHTLVTRLGLLPRQVFFPRHRQERLRQDQAVWMRRPLPESLLEAAVKNVNETHRVPVEVQRILEAPARQTRARPDDENPGVVHNVLTHLDSGMQFTRNVWRTERP
ncbi:piRNA biogenesis protein EXD1 [Amphibalanus amphitrite]|uniref:PiRNA biogenesis protein EXD1 n=1 Tax=Amphibalanus amphitrite TaxID=1232801 RepID=A0A6A4WZH7_AMPAM|nr:piRNA biogenesis protein EXD1 [Amphibalanus amphitrite]